MKKLKLCALFAAALVALLIMTIPSYADESDWDYPNPEASYTQISLEEPIQVNYEEDMGIKTYEFTPDEDGNYCFTTEDGAESDNFDTVGRLLTYDSEAGIFEVLEEQDDFENDEDYGLYFKIWYDCKKDVKYYLQVRVYDNDYESQSFNVSVRENPITRIDYSPAETLVLREFTNGYVDHLDNGNSYFRYSYPSAPSIGDEITVYEKEKDPITYTCKNNSNYEEDDDYDAVFEDANGNKLDGSVWFTDDQYETPWTVDDNNIYYAVYNNVKCSLPVTVNPLDVSSITLTHEKEYIMTEEADGEWVDEGDNRWFRYREPSFDDGDILTITNSEDQTESYSFDSDDYCFYPVDDETGPYYWIPGEVLEVSSDQSYNNQWTIEGPNYFTVSLKGKASRQNVTIIENNVLSISFQRADGSNGYTYTEYDPDHGYFTWNDDDSYFYYYVGFEPGDQITVNYKEGPSSTFIWKADADSTHGGYFQDPDNEDAILTYEMVEPKFAVPQYEAPLEAGNTYDATLVYMGRECSDSIKVTIQAGSLNEAVAEAEELIAVYRSLNPDDYTESTWNDYEDCCKELIYALEDEDYSYGYIIRLIGYVKSAYDELRFEGEDEYDSNFQDVPSGEIESIEPGDTKTVYIDTAGKTATYEFTPEESGTYTFESDEYIDPETDDSDSYDTVGRMLIKKDGRFVQKVRDDDSGPSSQFSFEFDAVEGETYYLQARLYSTTDSDAKFIVRLKEYEPAISNISWIDYSPVKPLTLEEKIDGRFIELDEEYDYETRFFYDTSNLYQPGDQLILNMDDDSVEYYTYTDISSDGEDADYFFVNDDNPDKMINPAEISLRDEQLENKWYVGEHIVYGTYENIEFAIHVDVVSNNIDTIEFTPVTTYEYEQNDERYGSFRQRGDGGTYFRYKFPPLASGDILTVNRYIEYELVSEEYTYDPENEVFVSSENNTIELDQIYRYSPQYEEPWLPDQDNYIYIEYGGKQCQNLVTIIPVSIDSLEFSTDNILTFEENVDGHYMLDDYTYDEYFHYDIPDNWYQVGDRLTATIKDSDDVKNYVCQEKDDKLVFVNEEDPDDTIDLSNATITDPQSSNDKWVVNEQYEFSVSYRGVEFSVPVNIVPNTVTDIKFDPVKPYSFDEYDEENGQIRTGSDDEEYFYYYLPYFKDDDCITVTRNTGDETTTDKYYYSEDTEEFICSENGKVIPEVSALFYTRQSREHWQPNKENYIIFNYAGIDYNVPVTINETEKGKLIRAEKVANSILSSISGLEENDYTVRSWRAMKEAQQNLLDALEDPDRTSAQIKSLTSALSTAIASLVYKEDDPDAQARAEAVTDANALLNSVNIQNAVNAPSGTYGSTSYAAFMKAKKDLENAMDESSGMTSTEIRDAIAALETAYDNLKTPEQEARAEAVNTATAYLNSTAITNAVNAPSGTYGEKSYATFLQAKKNLEDAIKDDSGKTSSQINAAKTILENAYASLKTPEEEARIDAVNAASTYLKSTEITNAVNAPSGTYGETSYAAFLKAKKDLEDAIKDDSGKTSTQILAAKTALENAYTGLKTPAQEAEEKEAAARAEAVTTATNYLNSTAITNAVNAPSGTYSETTYSAFLKAKNDLENAIKDGSGKTSTEILAAKTALENAYAGLKTPAQEEAAAKEAAVAEANTLLTSDEVKNADAAQADYTVESFKTYSDSKVALDAALKDSTKTSADINKLIEALRNALKGLRTKSQEAAAKAIALENADILATAARKLTASKYTTATFTPFKNALAELNKILASPDEYNSNQINAAVDNLTTMQAALKLKKVNPMTAKGKKVTAKASVLKKRSKTFKKTQAFTIRKAKGTVTFKITKKAKKAGKKIVISKKGKVTLKKGLKKGKYVMKVRVTASGNGIYKKKVTYIKKFTVVVK